jgi:hypothetical protein
MLYVPAADLAITNSVFCIYGFPMIFIITAMNSLHSMNKLIFVIVKCYVLFEVRTKY